MLLTIYFIFDKNKLSYSEINEIKMRLWGLDPRAITKQNAIFGSAGFQTKKQVYLKESKQKFKTSHLFLFFFFDVGEILWLF